MGNCVLRWGKIFGEVVRGAQFCLKGRTAFEGGGESRRLPRSAQPNTAGGAQVCERRRLSGWEILRRLGKPSECSKVDFTRMRHPPEGASPALCYAKR